MLDAQLLLQIVRFIAGGLLLFLSLGEQFEVGHLELFVGVVFAISLDQKTLPTQILSLASLIATGVLIVYMVPAKVIVFSWLIFSLLQELFFSPKRSNILLAFICMCFSFLATNQFIEFKTTTAAEQTILAVSLLAFGLLATRKFVGPAILPVVSMLLPQIALYNSDKHILIVAIAWLALEIFAVNVSRIQLKSAALFVSILIAPDNFWTLGALFILLLPENKLFNQRWLDLSVSVLALFGALIVATEIQLILPVFFLVFILLLRLSNKNETEVAIG